MKIEILPVYENLLKNISQLDHMSVEEFWDTYAIEPYWKKICCYAPMNLDDRKPKLNEDKDTLKAQLKLLLSIEL